jgi:inosine-uridine nucleoside N-ribohydrolase
VDKAKKYSPEDPLYIVAIGAITNVASAILLDKETMINNTVVVWLGGHALHYHNTKEFNMKQDIAGARILFGCGVPLVILPCNGVVSEFRTTKGELAEWLNGQNALGTYLYENTVREAESYAKGKAWSRCIWDVTAVAWLLNDDNKFMSSRIIPSLIPQYDGHYSEDFNRHPIRYIYKINRDVLFTDLFTKIRSLNK